MKLSDAKAIVTGAAGGLGGHFALELARAGARVVAGDTNAAGLRQLASQADDLPGELSVAKLDITDEESATDFVAEAAERMGGVNVLVNSAGIARDGLLVQPDGAESQKLPLSQWRKVVDVNLTGQFLMAREFAARFVAGQEPGEAVIVNLSSIARAGNPGQSNYAASKSGLDACTRTWALELARYRIRVCGVAPGVTETGFLGGFSDETLARLKAGIPLGRLGRPEEIWLRGQVHPRVRVLHRPHRGSGRRRRDGCPLNFSFSEQFHPHRRSDPRLFPARFINFHPERHAFGPERHLRGWAGGVRSTFDVRSGTKASRRPPEFIAFPATGYSGIHCRLE